MRDLKALAATVLVAFGLGSLAGSHWPTHSTSDRTAKVAGNITEADPHSPIGMAASTVETPRNHPRSAPVQAYAVLEVATESAGSREIHLPVLEGQASNERWLRPDPEALPQHIRRQLEQQGYQLQQRRRFLEVQLEDGRHAVIPVDQYQVEFVGAQSS